MQFFVDCGINRRAPPLRKAFSIRLLYPLTPQGQAKSLLVGLCPIQFCTKTLQALDLRTRNNQKLNAIWERQTIAQHLIVNHHQQSLQLEAQNLAIVPRAAIARPVSQTTLGEKAMLSCTMISRNSLTCRRKTPIMASVKRLMNKSLTKVCTLWHISTLSLNVFDAGISCSFHVILSHFYVKQIISCLYFITTLLSSL